MLAMSLLTPPAWPARSGGVARCATLPQRPQPSPFCSAALGPRGEGRGGEAVTQVIIISVESNAWGLA